MKKQLILICLIFYGVIFLVSCSRKGYPNYQVTPNGYTIWRYTKTQEEVKDVFSNGDTLFDNGSALVLIKGKDTSVLADYSKMIHKELRNQLGVIIADSIKNKNQ